LVEHTEIDLENSDERTLRTRLRKRIRDSISEYNLLFEHLSDADREQLLAAPKTSDSTAKTEELTELSGGVACLFALLYEAIEDAPGGDFKHRLQNAMHRVAERNGWILEEFDLTIEFAKTPDLDDWEGRFDEGEATIQEATILLQRDRISSDEFTEYVESQLGR
jgi:hypothetical protein